MESDQEAVVDWLSRADTWGGTTVEQVQTHAARVFLVGRHAYKMKRAVGFSFLDFSTLDRRRAALEAELRLNRRTAPMLYRRVLPVTMKGDGHFALDGEGEPVEWLLEMVRFEADARLDVIADQGPLPEPLVDDLADAVGDLHEQAAVDHSIRQLQEIAEVIDGNRTDFETLRDCLPAEPVRNLVEATAAELGRQRTLLEQRARKGRVRHVHGDLHTANIVMLRGRPVLFDCLEFDPALATIDVLYDLAFLLMDLMHRGQRVAARHLLSVYLERTVVDDEGVALLPLFLATRAAIRAKVEGFEARDDPGHAREAERYLDQALRFLEDRPDPRLIAIGGLSGTGKSTLARAVADRLGPMPGAVIVRSDGTRKRLAGRGPTERLGPEAYRDEVTVRVFDRVAARARSLLEAGHSVVADAVFLRAEQRAQIERAARSAGAPFVGMWLEADPADLLRRVEARRSDASDATPDVVRRQLELDPGPLSWMRLAAGGRPADPLGEALRLIDPE